MVALDDGGLKGEFMVWGGDISHDAIKIARRGRYGHRAVATVPDDYRATIPAPASRPTR